MLIIDALTSVWLFANVLYYREFSDFLTFALIKGSGAVSNNLNKGIMGIVQPTDFIVFADVLILILLLVLKSSGWTFDRLRNALRSGFRC